MQVQNPDGSLSNTETFVVLAPGSGAGGIPLTPSAPTSAGNDIVVVELSTNGGSGAAGNVSLNIAAIGAYSRGDVVLRARRKSGRSFSGLPREREPRISASFP